MKTYIFIVSFISILSHSVLAQKNIYAFNQKQEKRGMNINDLPDFNRYIMLEATADTTANVSMGDFDGDGHLDIILVKVRHLPSPAQTAS
jgi:hypothetical protein